MDAVDAFLFALRVIWARIVLAYRLLFALLRLDPATVAKAAQLDADDVQEALAKQIHQQAPDDGPPPSPTDVVLAVDIGGTRTKFLLADRRLGTCRRLPPAPTAQLWQSAVLEGDDKFDPAGAPARLGAYLVECGIDLGSLTRLAFSVPGTVEITERKDREEMSVVKNTPSMSPRFRGFDFKEAFRPLCPRAKVSATADNLAAALGVACQHRELRSALVLVLGTAPAAATLFRDPSGKGKYVETAIWQSWVWFTKVPLADAYGYCGGLKVSADGISVKPPTECKVPHHQSRIRFALDDATWRRIRGLSPPPAAAAARHPPPLDAEAAAAVWSARLQAAVDALARTFHAVYGPPEAVHVLGGNASVCHGRVTKARYTLPDASHPIEHEVPVVVGADDEAQQRTHMSGLLYSNHFKLKQVYAPGQDPLARGWTRGGEIYLWTSKDGNERELPRYHHSNF